MDNDKENLEKEIKRTTELIATYEQGLKNLQTKAAALNADLKKAADPNLKQDLARYLRNNTDNQDQLTRQSIAEKKRLATLKKRLKELNDFEAS